MALFSVYLRIRFGIYIKIDILMQKWINLAGLGNLDGNMKFIPCAQNWTKYGLSS